MTRARIVAVLRETKSQVRTGKPCMTRTRTCTFPSAGPAMLLPYLAVATAPRLFLAPVIIKYYTCYNNDHSSCSLLDSVYTLHSTLHNNPSTTRSLARSVFVSLSLCLFHFIAHHRSSSIVTHHSSLSNSAVLGHFPAYRLDPSSKLPKSTDTNPQRLRSFQLAPVSALTSAVPNSAVVSPYSVRAYAGPRTVILGSPLPRQPAPSSLRSVLLRHQIWIY